VRRTAEASKGQGNVKKKEERERVQMKKSVQGLRLKNEKSYPKTFKEYWETGIEKITCNSPLIWRPGKVRGHEARQRFSGGYNGHSEHL